MSLLRYACCYAKRPKAQGQASAELSPLPAPRSRTRSPEPGNTCTTHNTRAARGARRYFMLAGDAGCGSRQLGAALALLQTHAGTVGDAGQRTGCPAAPCRWAVRPARRSRRRRELQPLVQSRERQQRLGAKLSGYPLNGEGSHNILLQFRAYLNCVRALPIDHFNLGSQLRALHGCTVTSLPSSRSVL